MVKVGGACRLQCAFGARFNLGGHSLDPRVEELGQVEEERVDRQGSKVLPEEDSRVANLRVHNRNGAEREGQIVERNIGCWRGRVLEF